MPRFWMSSAVTETTGEAVAAAGLRVIVPVTTISPPPGFAAAGGGVTSVVWDCVCACEFASCEVVSPGGGGAVGAKAGLAIAKPAITVVASNDVFKLNFDISFP